MLVCRVCLTKKRGIDMTQALRFVLSVLVLLILLACGPTEEDRERQVEAAQLRKTRALLSSMIARHNASIGWDKQLNERLFAFSIDVQRAIAAQQTRPLVIFCGLRDVYSRDGKVYVLAEYESSSSDVLVFFDLEAQGSLLRSITAAEKYDSFAFVVNPSGTAVPLLKARVEPQSDEVLIESAETVIVRGHLLDSLRIDNFTADQLVP